jgi:hypothetical protein
MPVATQLIIIWAFAFVTLAAAVALLRVYYGLIGKDLILRSLGQEAALAGIASMIEAGSVWSVVTFVPTAAQALFIPMLLVAILYKVCHLEDWSRYDILFLLVFQMFIGFVGTSLFSGHFQTALILVLAFGGALALLANIVRSS